MEIIRIDLNNAAGGTVARYAIDTEAFDAWWELEFRFDPFGQSEWIRTNDEEIVTRLDEFAEQDRLFNEKLNDIR